MTRAARYALLLGLVPALLGAGSARAQVGTATTPLSRLAASQRWVRREVRRLRQQVVDDRAEIDRLTQNVQALDRTRAGDAAAVSAAQRAASAAVGWLWVVGLIALVALAVAARSVLTGAGTVRPANFRLNDRLRDADVRLRAIERQAGGNAG